MNLWDKLIPQAVLNLNLLRQLNLNPDLSAFARVWGKLNFNQTPLASPGTMVIVHKKLATHKTWAPHTSESWYLGPAIHHYRCYRVWVWEIKAERISNMLAWHPTNVDTSIPGFTDRAIATATDLISALQNPSPVAAIAPIGGDNHPKGSPANRGWWIHVRG